MGEEKNVGFYKVCGEKAKVTFVKFFLLVLAFPKKASSLRTFFQLFQFLERSCYCNSCLQGVAERAGLVGEVLARATPAYSGYFANFVTTKQS